MRQTKITFLLYCDWELIPPVYRIYIDGELFAERSYIWNNSDHVLQEIISADLSPTQHELTVEPVGIRTGTFRINRVVTNNDTPIKATVIN